jgi:hypothetical protein
VWALHGVQECVDVARNLIEDVPQQLLDQVEKQVEEMYASGQLHRSNPASGHMHGVGFNTRDMVARKLALASLPGVAPAAAAAPP